MKKIKLERKNIIISAIIVSILLIIAITLIIIKRKNETIQTVIGSINFQEEMGEYNNEIEEEDILNVVLEEEENKEEKNNNKQKEENNINTAATSNKNAYYIKINYGANVVTIYTKDESGNYSVPVKAMICSTGKATPTSGVYKLNGTKHRWGTLFGNVYGQYTTAIVGNILFHSVPYLRKGDPASLEYWAYDKLGTRASAGCIRLTVQDAIWIYNNIATGTPVEFYSDSNPGPLGKPSAQKISNNTECRNWDPTDPGEGNPWRNQQTKVPTQNTEVQTSTTTEQAKPNTSPNNTGSQSKPEEPKKDNNTIKENTTSVENTIANNTVINNTITNNALIEEGKKDNTIKDTVDI